MARTTLARLLRLARRRAGSPGGPRHVEHQLPRALDRDDRSVNVVAAHPACHLAKVAMAAVVELVAVQRTGSGVQAGCGPQCDLGNR